MIEAPATGRAARRTISGDFVEAVRYLEREGWTDGLPVIPPTEPLVAKMLSYTKRGPNEVLGQMEPLRGTVTVEKVAANAVMAGCLPEYFPVVLASVRSTDPADDGRIPVPGVLPRMKAALEALAPGPRAIPSNGSPRTR